MIVRKASPATRICVTLPLLLAFPLLPGCIWDPYGPVVVSGNVTYDGEPIATGKIRFVPIEGTKGPVSGAPIKDGIYEVIAKGGVPRGKHRVGINATRTIGDAAANQPGGAGIFAQPIEQYLPARYNKESELRVTVESEMTQDYDLVSTK